MNVNEWFAVRVPEEMRRELIMALEYWSRTKCDPRFEWLARQIKEDSDE